MDKAKLIGIAPRLVVKNVVTTAEYYRDTFGFTIIDYFLDPPVYAMVERDGFQIHFCKSDNDTVQMNETIRKGVTDFIIWIPEIDTFFEELKSRNAIITQGIVKRVYGGREFIIGDCDGHTFLIAD